MILEGNPDMPLAMLQVKPLVTWEKSKIKSHHIRNLVEKEQGPVTANITNR
jgi:hypothetical protein